MFLSLALFLARAGGGVGGGGSHSSSGGSHSSSSHFSGGGGVHTFVGGGTSSSSGSSTSGSLLDLLIIVPIILIVLLVVFIAHRKTRRARPDWPSSMSQGWPSSGQAGPTPPVSEAPAQDWNGHVVDTAAVAAGLEAIKAHDPAFDEDAFLSTVERCFFAVEEAWSQQRPDLSRPVMAEDAWERQKAEIETYRSAGKRNVLDNLTVAKATILAAGSEDGHDEVTVRFRAASANYDVDIGSGRVLRGNHQMAFWEQDWVFQRSSQATSSADAGSGQRCPNCGAPLDLDIAGVCKNCKASVRSASADWLVVSAGQAQHIPS